MSRLNEKKRETMRVYDPDKCEWYIGEIYVVNGKVIVWRCEESESR